ncbi:unnamed protein product [Ectocarpus sp. CCAP 1310/34]|nr:unnamed protein product [Ectocarpus sp. CCAP 1310/34]
MILDPAWSRPLASFGVPIASINSESFLSFTAISGTLPSFLLLLAYLFSICILSCVAYSV